MKVVFLAFIIGLLLCDASGAMALVTAESCTAATDTVPDGKCPPLCARCACGVPSVIPPVTSLAAVPFVCSEPTVACVSIAPDAPPHKILHVPK